MALTIEAKEVEQPPERERETPYRMGLAWPALGWLPDDLEKLRKQAARYPLQTEER